MMVIDLLTIVTLRQYFLHGLDLSQVASIFNNLTIGVAVIKSAIGPSDQRTPDF
jgi:hypothetical protein